jgi:uncharacterized spore protein YtfJ
LYGEEDGGSVNVQEIMDRMAESLTVKRSFGEAYESNGTLVIPVAFVSGGGGGGEGTTVASESDDEVRDDGADESDVEARMGQSGSGGGFGGVVIPLGVYVVADDTVTWKPVLSANLLAVMTLLFATVVLRTFRRRRGA